MDQEPLSEISRHTHEQHRASRSIIEFQGLQEVKTERRGSAMDQQDTKEKQKKGSGQEVA